MGVATALSKMAYGTFETQKNKTLYVNQWYVESNIDKATPIISICYRRLFFRYSLPEHWDR